MNRHALRPSEGHSSAVRILRMVGKAQRGMALEVLPFRSVARPTFVRLPSKARHGTAGHRQ